MFAAIWKKLMIYFASQSRAHVKKMKLQLKVSKKDRSISTYILEFKKIIDSLTAIGSPPFDIETILDGLSDDYNGFVMSILSGIKPYIVEELEALLLAHEERLEEHKQVDNVFQVNATTSSWHSSTCGRFQDRAGRQRLYQTSSVRRGRSLKNNSSHSKTSSSHHNSNTHLQCQLCVKYGHTIASCWHCFDQHFQSPIQLHNSKFLLPILIFVINCLLSLLCLNLLGTPSDSSNFTSMACTHGPCYSSNYKKNSTMF